jgi:tRNA pseudouridine55 synthase
VRADGKEIAGRLTKEDLQSVLPKYMGTIDQQVPAYSAVHVDGTRLYGLARSGGVLEKDLPVKKVVINDIKITSFTNNEHISYPELKTNEGINCTIAELSIMCGKGTYIRSLARDIGKDLGCGAVVVSLIRTKTGDYCAKDCLSLDEVLLKHLKS